MSLSRALLSSHDFEDAARRRLPAPLFGFVSGGSEDNATRESNRHAFARYQFVPRVLRNVQHRQQSVTLFGRRYDSPFGIAPMGALGLMAARGDAVMASAAAKAGIPVILSGASSVALEVIHERNPDAWFQAYLSTNVDATDKLLDRLAGAGYSTLVVTVDVPVSANRENNVRSGYVTPLRPSMSLAWQLASHPRWLFGTMLETLRKEGVPHYENMADVRGPAVFSAAAARQFRKRDGFTWEHVARIRRRWKGHLVLKGILSPLDVVIAREHDVDGVIVSNHGGRQLDGSIATIAALSAVVDAAGAVPVMIDGGFRRGTDILKAIALGARMVFIGRSFNYAVAVAGAAGVEHLAGLLIGEVDRDMAFLGVSSIAALDARFIARRDDR